MALVACGRDKSLDGSPLGLNGLQLNEANASNAGFQKRISDERLLELAKSKEHINLPLSAAKNIFERSKANKSFSVDTMNLFRTTVYRFYSNVSVQNKRLSTGLNSGAEIGINEDLFQELKAGIEVMNKELSKKNDVNDQLSDSSIRASISMQLQKFPR
ncbi:hypothetical protein MKQ68_15110 [Chitinophaga horti]|uniref:Uncharacterized protein n=1 Tax=Chitinophaga horti TaxID=2920382 RepID=A0ABY6IZ56_9BACT|nr:hypothetical protein [Chitinophaga horti]UYQ91421.1 hypothetical protein MKQ68_15110 [Chitinophaga horti]